MKINDKDEGVYPGGDEEEGGEGQSGVGGKIHFRYKDAASLGPRDDMLPPHEIRRLLEVHGSLHKQRVDKQKLTRQERAALKEGKVHLKSATQQASALRNGGISKYKKHPISNKAQFSGMDRQMIGVPSEFDAETNLEMRDKLENRFTHRNTPKFNPTLKPRG